MAFKAYVLTPEDLDVPVTLDAREQPVTLRSIIVRSAPEPVRAAFNLTADKKGMADIVPPLELNAPQQERLVYLHVRNLPDDGSICRTMNGDVISQDETAHKASRIPSLIMPGIAALFSAASAGNVIPAPSGYPVAGFPEEINVFNYEF